MGRRSAQAVRQCIAAVEALTGADVRHPVDSHYFEVGYALQCGLQYLGVALALGSNLCNVRPKHEAPAFSGQYIEV